MPELNVQSGAVIALRLFDIAYSIDLFKAESLWMKKVGGSISRSRLSSAPPKALKFDVPPGSAFPGFCFTSRGKFNSFRLGNSPTI